MTTEEHRAVMVLARCRFVPGSYGKRFVNDLWSMECSARELTPKQAAYLRLMTWRFRNQIYKLEPDFDMTFALNEPLVIDAIQKLRARQPKGKRVTR